VVPSTIDDRDARNRDERDAAMLIAIARHFRRLDRCSSIRSATARSPIRDLRAYPIRDCALECRLS